MTAQTFMPGVSSSVDHFVVSEGLVEPTGVDFTNGSIPFAVKDILREIGENPAREGLLKTPERVARMYAEITAGYKVDPVQLVNGALFDVDYSEMVLVKDIDFYSMCEHHMLPFFGHAYVAYSIPHRFA